MNKDFLTTSQTKDLLKRGIVLSHDPWCECSRMYDSQSKVYMRRSQATCSKIGADFIHKPGDDNIVLSVSECIDKLAIHTSRFVIPNFRISCEKVKNKDEGFDLVYSLSFDSEDNEDSNPFGISSSGEDLRDVVYDVMMKLTEKNLI